MLGKFITAFFFIFPGLAWSQTTYVVRPGDTLLKIADQNLGNTDRNNPRRYEFVKKTIKMNPDLKNPNALEPGQTIVLPTEAPAKKETHGEHAEAAVAAAPPPTPVAEPTPAPTPVAVLPPPTNVTNPMQTPVAEATPPAEAPKETVAPTDSHKEASAHHNFIFVQPRFQMIDLVAKDEVTHTKAKMKSKSSVGLDLQYGVILSERFHLLFQAGVTSTQFGDLEGVVGTVNHKSETLKNFAAGVAFEATHSLHLDLMAFYAEHTFLLPPTTTEYKLEAIAIPGAELNISWDFYSGSSSIFGISAIGEYLSAVKKDEVEYKSTVEPFGSLYWKSKLGPDRVNYKVTLTYKQGHQKTSVNKKAEDVSVLGVGFYF